MCVILGYLVIILPTKPNLVVQMLRFGNLKRIRVKSSSVVSKRKKEEARGKKVRNKQELVDNKNAHKE